MTGRRAILVALVSTLLPLQLAAQTVGPPDPLIRNCVPAAWQADDVLWIRDVAPHNKIDDLIDDSDDPLVDVVVNFNRCIRQTDLERLAERSPQGRLVLKGRFIPFVSMSDVPRDDVAAIAALPQVAFVERKLGFGAGLATSVGNIRVANAAGFPDTVENRFPGLDGSGVNIAVLDTGVDDPGGPPTTHLTFPAALQSFDATVPNFANPDDANGHGTHVAAIALGRGIAGTVGSFPRGVAPGAGLIDVRVFAGATGNWDDVVRALEQVYLNRDTWEVGVVNMSLSQRNAMGGMLASDGLDAFSQLVDLAEAMGIVVVAAASNFGPGNMGLPTPAAASRAIAVAASNDQGSFDRALSTLYNLSNRGPRRDPPIALDDLKPDVTAPGESIGSAQLDTVDGQILFDGTSMAAPHVAGLAALILQERPGMHPSSVKQLLIETAEPRGTASAPALHPAWSREWGFGLVNGFAAIDRLRELARRADLTFPSFPADPSWLSPDVSTRDAPRVGVPNEARVRIFNRGPNPARDFRVQFGVFDYAAAIPAFAQIGTVIVPELLDGAETTVVIPWTPAARGHLCLQVEIGYGPDTDPSNNVAQRNLDVARSPVVFEVRNTLTEEPAEIRFVPTLDPPTNEWTVTITPESVVLAADDCPVEVEVLLEPLPGAAPGSVQRVHVAATIGDALLGGVTVEHSVPAFPDCNDNGVDDAIDLLEGGSADANGNEVPDECETSRCGFLFSGTAQGGSVSIDLLGFSAVCTVSIVTAVGQSAAAVAAALAAAVNADPCADAQGLAATASGERLRIEGFLLQCAGPTSTDPGLAPVVDVPTLSGLGAVLMVLLLAGAALLSLARRSRSSRSRSH